MWFVVAGLGIVAVYLLLYALWTARRLDRLHARVDAAGTALAAQLARRSSMAREFGTIAALDAGTAELLARAASAAAAASALGHGREVVEAALTRALAVAVGSISGASSAATEIHDEALRASIARRFYNDTVRDALVVRDRRVVRWLRLAGHAPHPAYFEMDDVELAVSRISVPSGPNIEG